MPKRITISVSDGLHQKMMEVKEVFNFSKVFQDAITELIERREDFQKRLKGDDKMTEIIERLRKEQAESESYFFEDGKVEGLDWAKSAHYEEIQYVLSWDVRGEPADDSVLEYFNEYYLEDDEYPLFSYGTDAWVNESMEKFLEGWKEGVVSFWDEIQDKL